MSISVFVLHLQHFHFLRSMFYTPNNDKRVRVLHLNKIIQLWRWCPWIVRCMFYHHFIVVVFDSPFTNELWLSSSLPFSWFLISIGTSRPKKHSGVHYRRLSSPNIERENYLPILLWIQRDENVAAEQKKRWDLEQNGQLVAALSVRVISVLWVVQVESGFDVRFNTNTSATPTPNGVW